MESASGLKGRGNDESLAPFFYYQFYTFDDSVSETKSGSNPKFSDEKTFKMDVNETTKKYYQTQDLKIFVVDDNAPQAEGKDEDIIGICKIPLAKLVLDNKIEGSFDLKNSSGLATGSLKVKLELLESDTQQIKGIADRLGQRSSPGVSVFEHWQENIVKLIAQKLAALSLDIDMMFGIFACGYPTCEIDDFKYICMKRLNLSFEIEESDLDKFLSVHSRVRGKNSIDQADFDSIFRKAILEARRQDPVKDVFQTRMQQMQSDTLNQRDLEF